MEKEDVAGVLQLSPLEREKVFRFHASQIHQRIASAQQALEEKNLLLAKSLHQKGKQQYTLLPQLLHPMQERLEQELLQLEAKLQDAERQVESQKKEHAVFWEQVGELRGTASKNPSLAKQAFSQLIAFYRNLPKGFLHQQWEMESALLELQRMFQLSQPTGHADMLLSMVEAGKSHIQKSLPAARQVYLHALELAHALPNVFFLHHPETLFALTDLYQELLVKEVEQERERSAHLEMVRLLVEIQEHRYLAEWNAAKEKYMRAKRLLHHAGSRNRKMKRELEKLHSLFVIHGMFRGLPLRGDAKKIVWECIALQKRFPEEKGFCSALQEKAMVFAALQKRAKR
ncbi:hypothetical protein HYS48_03600 [Candidatus Woesearchaeota archaeon]|nr:hypothetical protein [Candidatus Woesearchaeota archaeon]